MPSARSGPARAGTTRARAPARRRSRGGRAARARRPAGARPSRRRRGRSIRAGRRCSFRARAWRSTGTYGGSRDPRPASSKRGRGTVRDPGPGRPGALSIEETVQPASSRASASDAPREPAQVPGVAEAGRNRVVPAEQQVARHGEMADVGHHGEEGRARRGERPGRRQGRDGILQVLEDVREDERVEPGSVRREPREDPGQIPFEDPLVARPFPWPAWPGTGPFRLR